MTRQEKLRVVYDCNVLLVAAAFSLTAIKAQA
jgi:hypothetical protein